MKQSIYEALDQYHIHQSQNIKYTLTKETLNLKTLKKNKHFLVYNGNVIPKSIFDNNTLVTYKYHKEYTPEQMILNQYKICNSLDIPLQEYETFGLITNIYNSKTISIDIDRIPYVREVDYIHNIIDYLINTFPIQELYFMLSSVIMHNEKRISHKYHIHLVLDNYYDVSSILLDRYFINKNIICKGYVKLSILRGKSNIRIYDKKYLSKNKILKYSSKILPIITYINNKFTFYYKGDL